MSPSLINFVYIVASILFVLGIKMLGSAKTARKGNLISSVGMLMAVVVTLLYKGLDFKYIVVGLIIGGAIGLVAAKRVKMTAMPEMVALFNGFGGLASLLVGWAEYEKIRGQGFLEYFTRQDAPVIFTSTVIVLAVLIGGITFTGSIQAWGKLSGKLGSRAVIIPAQRLINGAIVGGIVLLSLLFIFSGNLELSSGTQLAIFLGVVLLSLALGVLGVLPIGGGDMPVVIALLNSFSGLAAAAAGFVILNNVLIVAGCLVGCSGLILTIIMCKAMNRSLTNVLFSGFGSSTQKTGAEVKGEMKAASVEDAYYVLEAASSVVIIPGYGMAVAQAQHVVKELGELLEANGCEVKYAIHPVAGRMPGHMNVLLAEADVPYEQLVEMDDINPTMPSVDVAIVIGANDVVNPAAADDEASPIYGMPIINAHLAKTVYALKRGQGAGFSGLINQLYFLEKTRMLYGDAKATVSALVGQLKED
ncbi:NAD(P)(+) transhydrogenase (Re/Si-specific) subunit beta [Puniceicoccales bacterium CK1056]|uniref:NAD(P) transhydrogenase subunit beta n=1 Tax=Oceanipulchritudo coccoides TaxID=2706888 RepID=A0A6B2M1M5_9BACT|nr:NAD(P)(+) transhydrogenase (Re/Si-specific) subunit beta [Oceanipulchritudo coccoides]NDV62623.1 NAD(P)(+) transhydrogenase (Re/Si-specific) subunit beta [Oceanipulchritudo coccoides]